MWKCRSFPLRGLFHPVFVCFTVLHEKITYFFVLLCGIEFFVGSETQTQIEVKAPKRAAVVGSNPTPAIYGGVAQLDRGRRGVSN